jgi:predicted dehydrogenase
MEDQAMEKKIKTGVVGLGKMGILHSALVNMIPEAELVSVHDTNRKLSKYVANSKMDVPFYPHLGQMLENADLEAVFICTPPFTHLSIAQTCLDHHLNIFVEKPLAESLSSAKKMVALLENQKVLHATGFTLAHIPLYKKAKELLNKGLLGKMDSFKISIYFSQVLSKKKGWFTDKNKSGGGVMIDIASHVIYLAIWYFGFPQRVYGRTSNFYSQVEDSGSIFFEYTDGMSGVLDANWSIPGYRLATIDISIVGENGFMEVTNDHVKLNLHRAVAPYEEGWTSLHKIDLGSTSHFDLGGEGFYDEDRHFITCCLKGETPDVSWEDGLQVQRIVEAVYLSNEARAPVDMDSVR